MMNDKLDSITNLLQLFLLFGNACVMLYALKKFLMKPRSAIEERMLAAENEIKELKNAFALRLEKEGSQDKAIEVILHAVAALLEYEIHGCIAENKPVSENLESAKLDLDVFLRKR